MSLDLAKCTDRILFLGSKICIQLLLDLVNLLIELQLDIQSELRLVRLHSATNGLKFIANFVVEVVDPLWKRVKRALLSFELLEKGLSFDCSWLCNGFLSFQFVLSLLLFNRRFLLVSHMLHLRTLFVFKKSVV